MYAICRYMCMSVYEYVGMVCVICTQVYVGVVCVCCMYTGIWRCGVCVVCPHVYVGVVCVYVCMSVLYVHMCM